MPTELPTTELLPPSRVDRSFAKRLGEAPHVHNHSTFDKTCDNRPFRELSVAPVKKDLDRLEQIYGYKSMDPYYTTRKSLNSCRTGAVVLQHQETRELRIASKRCNLRWCPMCMRARRHVITESVKSWLQTCKHPKFLTLTLKHSNLPFEHQVERLYASFRMLRRRTWVSKLLTGGVWFFQFTYNNEKGQFHPHIHVLIDGDYIPKTKLRREWQNITFDSYICDIRKVENIDKAAEYVARYATAPANLCKIPVSIGAVAIVALKGRRIVGAFGSARGMQLSMRKTEDAAKWNRICGYWWLRVTSQWSLQSQMLIEELETPNFIPLRLYPEFDCSVVFEPAIEFEPESWKQAVFDFKDCFHCPELN